MRRFVLVVALAFGTQMVAGAAPPSILATLGLTPKEIATVDAGHPVVKVLAWGEPSEMYVFGAVRVDGSVETYLHTARDVGRLAGTPGYLGVGELPEDPTVADLGAVTLPQDDVKALRSCRDGACDLQLPTPSIQVFHDGVDYSRSDAAEQANALARAMMVQLIRSYRQGGHRALGEYRDTESPTRIGEEFETMILRASALPDVLPELRGYLLAYPTAPLPNADSFFYWEKIDFGLKPTIRVNHAVIYRGRAEGRDFGAVAIKQLYATHYFHTALDVSVCVDDAVGPNSRGFYLLTLKGSQQDGLTGAKGSMLRKIIVNKTRHSLESGLASVKRTVEQRAASDASGLAQ